MFRDPICKSHAAGQGAAARQRKGDFSGFAPCESGNDCDFGHNGHKWIWVARENHIKTLTAKDAKYSFVRLVDLKAWTRR
jgi:hypothetical protein